MALTIQPYLMDESLSELGYAIAQQVIVKYLFQEYRYRPSLVNELRSIKLIADKK